MSLERWRDPPVSDGADQPPDEARRLRTLLGHWTVKGTFAEGDKTAAVNGDWSFELALDGWGVLGTMATSIAGLGEFNETEVLGFDASTDKVHMFSANKFAIRDHEGGWVDRDRLRVRWVGSQEGRAVVEEITVHIDRSDHMTARVVESAGRTVIATTDLTLTLDNADIQGISDPERPGS